MADRRMWAYLDVAGRRDVSRTASQGSVRAAIYLNNGQDSPAVEVIAESKKNGEYMLVVVRTYIEPAKQRLSSWEELARFTVPASAQTDVPNTVIQLPITVERRGKPGTCFVCDRLLPVNPMLVLSVISAGDGTKQILVAICDACATDWQKHLTKVEACESPQFFLEGRCTNCGKTMREHVYCQRCKAPINTETEPNGVIYDDVLSSPVCTVCWSQHHGKRFPYRVGWEDFVPTLPDVESPTLDT